MAKTVRKIRYQPLEPRILLDAAAGVTFADSTADPDHQEDLQNQIALLREQKALEQKALEQKALEHKVADPRSEIRNNLPGAFPGAATDGAVPGTATDGAFPAAATNSIFRLEDPGAPAALPTDLAPSALVVVDTGVEGYGDLLTGLEPGTEILLIDADENGLQKLADHVAGRDDITSIHILSHGGQGEFSLGSVTLNSDNLDQHADLLAQIGAALTEQGDLLLYGCNVADGGDGDEGKRSGVEFVARIADVTGADVAASTDLTGAAGQGGDWNLEYTIGQIDGANLALTSFNGLLNDAPTATDDQGTTDQNTLLTGDLLLNDTDPNGDTLTISEVDGTADNLATATDGSNGGSFTIAADGSYSFNPDGDFDDLAPGATATTSIAYTVTDGSLTDTATLTVTVTATDATPTPGPTAQQDANRAPVATDDTGASNATSLLIVRAADTGINAGLLVNDMDPDGDTFTITRVGSTEAALGTNVGTAIFGSGNQGVFTIRADGAWSFDPNNNFNDLAPGKSRVASAAYEVSDAKGGTDVATLRVTVTAAAANQAPVATADQGATSENTIINVADGATGTNGVNADLLVNDSDADGDTLTIARFGTSADDLVKVGNTVDGSSGGRFTVSVNGAWSFDPDGDFNDLAFGATRDTRISYLLSDGRSGAVTTLTVTVTGDDVPTLTPATATLTEDKAPDEDGNLVATGTVTATGGDTGDDSFQPQTGAKGTVGSFTITAAGAWTYTADNSDSKIQGLKATDSLTDTFTVTSADTVTTTSVTITINGADDVPTLGLSAGTVTEDAVDSGGKNLVATGRVPITGGDTGDDKLTAATLTGSYGNLKVVADGTWTYTADNSQKDIQQLPANTTLSESFIVTSADTVTTGSVRIRINGADDAQTVTGPMTATVTEDMADAAGNLRTQTFTVTFSGGDLNEPYGFEQSTGATNAPSGAVLNLSGLTTPANTATWSFNVANDDPAVQAIGPGESLVLRYTVILADSITRLPFTVTIIGADDVPTLTSASATLTEDTAITDGNLVATGTVTATGGDTGENSFRPQTAIPGTVGSLTITAAGAWTYTAANSHADIQGLKATDSLTDTFIVTSADKVTTTSVTITINGKNDAPVATDDTGITDQNTAITATAAATGANPGLLLNDSDTDGETLTISQVDGATANLGKAIDGSNGGEFTISANGAWSFNPDGDFDDLAEGATATTSIAYTVSDPGGATDTATLTVTVTRPNRAPVAIPDQGETAENTIINVADGDTGTNADLLLNDTDPDGDTLTITGVNGFTAPAQDGTRQPQSVAAGAVTQGSTGGSFTLSANGAWRFDPGTDFDSLKPGESRDTQVQYTVSDGNLTGSLSAATTLTVTVTGADDVPVLTGATASVTEDAAVDADGNLVATGTVGSSGGDAGEIGFQPQTDTKGTVGSLTLATDGTWTYKVANQELKAGATLTDTFIVTSVDTVTTTSVTITINGVNDAPIAADDTGTAIGDRTTTVANDAPGTVITNDDSSTTTINADLLLNDSDPDGDTPLTITKVGTASQSAANLGKATGGSNGGEFTINADGSWSFDPDGDFDDLAQGASKTTSVVYTMRDPHGLTDTATLTVTVTPPVAPGATDDAGATTENTKLSVANDAPGTTTDGVTTNADLLLNDSRPDGATLTITGFAGATLVKAGATTDGTGGGSFTINADGSWEFDPGTAFNDLAKGATRTTSVAYTVAGGEATDRGTLTVTVTGVNDVPTAKDDLGAADNRVQRLIVADGDTGTTTTADGVTTTTNADLLLNDKDPDTADTLRISTVGSSATSLAAANLGKSIAGSDGGLFLIRANGSWNFSHNDAFTDLALGASRTTSVVYTLVDGNGGTSTATLTVTVTGVILNLVARDDYAWIDEDDSTFISVGNDAPGTTRTIIRDGVSVTITERADLLLNDFDPEGDTLTITRVHGFTADGKPQTVAAGSGTQTHASHGGTIFVGADGAYSFNARTDFDDLKGGETRETTVRYTVSDGKGDTATATLTITVFGLNTTPTTRPDLGATDENTVLTVKAGDTGIPGTTQTLTLPNTLTYMVTTNAGLLQNDFDRDDDALHVERVGNTPGTISRGNVGRAIEGSNGGTFTVNRDGSYTFDPDGDFDDLHYDDAPRTTSVLYRALDEGFIVSSYVSLTVSVTGVNYPPVAVDDLGTTDENTLLTVNNGDTATTVTITAGDGTTSTITGNADLLLNDTDPDGNPVVSFSVHQVGKTAATVAAGNVGRATDGSHGGSFTLAPNGSWTFNPDGDFADLEMGESRTTSVAYTLYDGRGGISAPGTVTVTVTGANNIPTAQNEQGRLDADETLTIAADAKATTVEGDTVSGGLLQNAVDPEGDTIRVYRVFDYGTNANRFVPVPAGGSVTVQGHAGGQITVHSDGAWSFDPDGDFDSASGAAAVTRTLFRITDDDGVRESGDYSLTISVYGPNTAPVAVDDTGATPANRNLSVADGATGTNADLLLNDTDADGDSASLRVLSAGTTADNLNLNLNRLIPGSNGGNFVIIADGGWVFFPGDHQAFRDLAPGESTTTSVVYRVTDGRDESANTATLTVTVNGVNDGPQLGTDTVAATENEVLTFSAADGLLANDRDPEGDTFTISRVFDPELTPVRGYVNVPAEGSITVAGRYGGSFNARNAGTFTFHADGAWTFDPGTDFDFLKAGERLQVRSSYYAVDANGAESRGPRSVFVNISGETDVLMAADDVGATGENAKITVADGGTGDLLLNDNHPEGVSFTMTAAGTTATSQAVGNLGKAIDGSNGGTFTINANGAWSFDPGTDFDDLGEVTRNVGDTRTTSVVYTVTDANGLTDTATLTVTVTGFNDPPTVVPSPATTDNNQVLTVAADALGVVFTDVADGVSKRHNVGLLIGATDPEGDRVVVNSVFDPAPGVGPRTINDTGQFSRVTVAGTVAGGGTGGLFTVQANGAWSFDPNGDFDDLATGETATVTLGYFLAAGRIAPQATLTLTVTPPNVEPVAVNDFGTATENGERTVADGATGTVVSITDDSGTVTSTMTINADLLLNDSDPDGDSFVISAVGGAAANIGKATDGSTGGSFTIAANGSWSFDADGDFEDLPAGGSRTTSITYTIFDGNESATATLTVTVTETNDAPTAVADTARAPSTSGLTTAAAAGLLANDRDLEGDTIRVSAVYDAVSGAFKSVPADGSVTVTGGKGGRLTVQSDGSWSFSPSDDFAYLASAGQTDQTAFPYKITDARGAESTQASLSITIVGENDAPTAVNDIGATTENAKITVADGATGTIVTNADSSTMTVNADLLLNDLDPDDPTLNDGLTEADSLAIIAVGKAENSQSAGNLGVATDGSNGGTFIIAANGAWSFDPGAAFDDLGAGETRTTSVAYTVEDVNQAADAGTLTVTVTGADDGPAVATNPATTDNNRKLTVAAADPGVLRTDADDGALKRHNVGLLVGATDIEGDAISVLYVYDTGAKAVPAGGSVTVEPASGGIFVIHSDGAWSFDPDGDFDGLTTVTTTATSSVIIQMGDPDNTRGAVTSITLSVTVTRANEAPVAAADFGSTGEDLPLTVKDGAKGTAISGDGQSFTINADLLLNDADANGDPLTISAVGGKAAGVGSAVDGSHGGSFTIATDGSWTFDPDDDFEDLAAGKTRTTSVIYTVTDGRDTDTATLTITVTETNDAPTVVDDTGATGENTVLTVAAAAGVLNNDNDPEAEAFTITAVKGYGAADQDGNRGRQDVAPGVVTQGSKGGAFTISADGAWRFDPGADFNNLAAGTSRATSIEYRVTDTRSGISDYATLTVTVTGLNDAPTAVDDIAGTRENAVLTVADGSIGTTSGTVTTNADLLLNDSDPDSTDTLTITRVNDDADNVGKATAGTNGGSFVIAADGSYSFDPGSSFLDLAAGVTVTTSVTYTIGDAKGGADTATLTLTVTGVNTAPVAVTDWGLVPSDKTLTVAADDKGTVIGSNTENAGLLVNDRDAEGDTIRVAQVYDYPEHNPGQSVLPPTIVTVPAGGSVTVGADSGGTFTIHSSGAWSFDPSTGDFGNSDTVLTRTVYWTTDGTSLSNMATIFVGVENPNSAPVALNDVGTTPETTSLYVPAHATGTTVTNDDGSTMTVNAGLTRNDKDAEGDRVRISTVDGARANIAKAVAGSNGGTFIISADGSYTFNPGSAFDSLAPGQSRTTSVTYTSGDGSFGHSNTATLTVTVTGVNSPPSTADREWFTGDNVPLARSTDRNLLSQGTDPEGDALRITQVYYRNDDINTLVPVAAPVPEDGSVTLRVYGPSSHRPYHGSYTVWSDGTWSYDPDGAFDDLVTGRLITTLITYQIADAHGATSADGANGVLRVSVRGVQSPPDAGDDFGATTENTAITVADGAKGTVVNGVTVHADVLLNDSDNEGDTLTILRVDGHRDNIGKAVKGSNGGIFTISADGAWSFDPDGDPDNNFNALAVGKTRDTSVTYTIGDGNAGDDQATLTVTVTGLNDNPTGLPTVVGEAVGRVLLRVDNDVAGTVRGDTRVNADLLTGAKDTDGDILHITSAGFGTSTFTPGGSSLILFNGRDGDRWYFRTDGSWGFQAGLKTTETLTSPDVSVERSAFYTVTDGTWSFTKTLTVTIRRANDAPDAVADLGTTPEDTVLTVANGDTATSTTITTTGIVTDDKGDTSTVITTGTITGNADLLNNDKDANNDILRISAVSGFTDAVDEDGAHTTAQDVKAGVETYGSHGGVFTIAANGSYTFDPDGDFDSLAPGQNRETSVTYTVFDGRESDTTTLTITVTGLNSPPVAGADFGTVGTEEGDLFVNFDKKGSTQTVTRNEPVTTTDDKGVTSTTYTTGTRTGIVNAGLLQNDYDPETGDTGTALRITRVFTVNDEGKELNSRPVPDGSGSGRLNPASGGEFVVVFNGTWFFDPDGDFNDLKTGETRDTSVNYELLHDGKTSTGTLTVTVTGTNEPPVPTDDVGATTENAKITVADGAKGDSSSTNADLLLNDFDADGDTLSITGIKGYTAVADDGTRQRHDVKAGVVTLGSSGGSFTLAANGGWSFDPGRDFDDLAVGKTRATSVQYTVADVHGDTSTATLTVTVSGENDPLTQVAQPRGIAEAGSKITTLVVAAGDTATFVTVTDDKGNPVTTITNAGLRSAFNDLDGDTLTIIAVNGKAANVGNTVLGMAEDGKTGGTFTINADGAWNFRPTFSFTQAGDSRTTSAKFTISDGQGSTIESTLTVTARRANMAPVGADDAGSATEDTAIVVADGATGTIRAGGGAQNADLLLNDKDPDSGNTLTITHVGATAASQQALTTTAIAGSDGGLFLIRDDGSYTFDPNNQFDDLAPGETRTTSVVYTLSDGALSDTATLTMTVTGVNDAPTAVNDTALASADWVRAVADGDRGIRDRAATNADVLLNDRDVDDDNDALTVSAVAGVAANIGRPVDGIDEDGAGGGKFTINADGSWEFDPDGDFDDLTGSQTRDTSVTYTVADSTGGTDIGTLTVRVSVNEAPTATNDLGATNDRLLIVADGATGTTSGTPGRVAGHKESMRTCCSTTKTRKECPSASAR